MAAHRQAGCPLCDGAGGRLVFEGAHFRVIHAGEAGFPAFYRLVWNAHVAEYSDLSEADRRLCMEAVVCVEQAMRDHLAPDKVNLAALGNVVPHLHWHVIARYRWDSRFPAPVWALSQRSEAPAELLAVEALLTPMEQAMSRALAGLRA